MITGNKGDWSEIYALFKLLGDKQIFTGDADLNRIEELFYPIIKILRNESDGNYEYTVDSDIIVISGSSEELRIPVDIFQTQATKLLESIKNASGAAFGIPETERFMHSVRCKTLKAKATDKTDIKIIIHDLRTNLQPTLGFSIKSHLGGASTLLNAGRTTNFVYKISGITLTESQISEINSISSRSKIIDRIQHIDGLGGALEYYRLENSIFHNNLVLIDSFLPEILAEIVRLYYSSNESTIESLVNHIEENNPLNFNTEHSHLFYKYKIKKFLTDVALGMRPASVWSGIYEANGGYLVVKEDGDVLCYHIYNKNEFEDYLFANTKLETAGSSKHDFGLIEKREHDVFFKLNLQIRFK